LKIRESTLEYKLAIHYAPLSAQLNLEKLESIPPMLMTRQRQQKPLPQNQRPCWIINTWAVHNFNPMTNEEVHMAIVEGKAAPAFTLPDANGAKVSLKDFKGQNVVVYFYPKDNTSG
jgi:hypothetical protein